MTTKGTSAELVTQIYDTASDWLVRQRSANLDEGEKRAFDLWLRTSPEHIRAYLEMSAIWEDLGDLSVTADTAPDRLIARARTQTNVVALELSAHEAAQGFEEVESAETSEARADGPGMRLRDWAVPRRVRFFAIAASILIAVAGLGTYAYTQRNIYSTTVGEQRTITLIDGTTAQLNSSSRIRVDYEATARHIVLLEGQALFKVAHDPGHPFIVDSNGTSVRAVGTQFDVYRKYSGTTVTVVEGTVAVADEASTTESPGPGTARPEKTKALDAWDERRRGGGEGPATSSEARGIQAHPGEILIAAGEQLTIPSSIPGNDGVQLSAAPTAPKTANIEAATAWTQQKLIFDFTPLQQVAEEFNRYTTRPLIIDSSELAQFHISGTFSSADPSLLLRFLRAQPHISVTETDREIRVSRK